MSLRILDQLEDTVTTLAMYLILAHKNHSRYILGEPDDTQQQIPPVDKLRLTQHYTAALLAYGFPPSVPELRWAADWFATPFSAGKEDWVDESEMQKLEGLLNLRPDDSGIPPRLKQLLAQRDGGYIEIVDRDETQGNRDPIFDTLWALKLIIMGRKQGALARGISEREIGKMLRELIPQCVKDKDLALALRLEYELDNKLDYPDALKALAERALSFDHLWGVANPARCARLKPITEAMRRGLLSPHVIEKELKLFRDVMVNTCYVIENLSPLAHLQPDCERELRESMSLWWGQFKGDKAPLILRTLFPNEYDYLMILSRTMVAVNAYAGTPLAAYGWQRPLREMARAHFAKDRTETRRDLGRALRHWIGIDLSHDGIKPLKLGLSEASVYRIEPQLYNPTDPKRNFLIGTSLIVKSGPVEQIEQERKRYAQLPARVRDSFVRIPNRTAYINKDRHAFVIMEDLNDFHTLYELIEPQPKRDLSRVGPLLSDFLINMHRGDGETVRLATTNHVRELYIVPMMRHIEAIAATLARSRAILDGKLERFNEFEAVIDDTMGTIIRHQRKLDRFPLALMHGDLHSRNIMIRRVRREGTGGREADLTIKLIDFEGVSQSGDAAHDAGQLLVDLNLLQLSTRRNLHHQVVQALDTMQGQLAEAYLDFATARGDTTFALRLELARARAFIRIAKGQSKRSDALQKDREFQRVLDELVEVIHLVEAATLHLKHVAAALERE
jgi:hypothetical protein